MLSYLRVRGLALLEDAEVNFESGMNVLTGETGAGKSIIVGALSLLRGARGRVEFVREGADNAIVDAQFEPPDVAAARIGGLLDEFGLPAHDADAMVIQRVVSRAGRGRSFVQSALTTQAALGRLGEELMDICSQHEHHFLTQTSKHLDVLDAYAQLTDDVAKYAERYERWRESEARLDELRSRTRERVARAEYLRFQLEEMDRIAPEPQEYETLRRRLTLLKDAHRWAEFARDAHALLYENDDAIAGRLATLVDRVRSGVDGSDDLAQIQEQLATAQIACEEAAAVAARFAGDLEYEPGELERVSDRLHELEGLRRKHGLPVDELAEHTAKMREEVEELDHAEEHLDALEARTQELLAACVEVAHKLRAKRKRASRGLAKAVQEELRALQIPDATLDVSVEPASDDGAPGPRGLDRVEFRFSANRGEPVAPLARVASGGELSRVLLAIKGVLAEGDRVATYVFDEVDAGVGGAVAESIGRRLFRASKGHQVLCITHLPQIAAFADAHFRVEKHRRRGRTTTRVVRLDPQARLEELARMLAGKKVTDSARRHAAALIEGAQVGRVRPGV